MDFEGMSQRELERRLANCSSGSINHGLIVPVLEAKRRRSDVRRNWIFFGIGTLLALLGLLAKVRP